MRHDTKAKTPKTGYETRYHRDGDVTVWSVHRQQWVRCPAGDVSDETLSTLPHAERERIARIAAREGNS